LRARIAAIVLFCALPATAGWFSKSPPHMGTSENAFKATMGIYRSESRDRVAIIESLKNYIRMFPKSPEALNAQFLIGEAAMDEALDSLKAQSKKKNPEPLSSSPSAPLGQYIQEAQQYYRDVALADKKGGLGASAQYRLGELAYDQKHWDKAIESFQKVTTQYSKSYIVPEALIGIVFSNLALENFSQAEVGLMALGEDFPIYLKEPAISYVRGIIALHNKKNDDAEKAFKNIQTANASYYLGFTYFLSKRPYLAAQVFEKMIRDYPQSSLDKEARMLLGDSFFLAKDYDGAIAKYKDFLASYPMDPLDSAAVFRLGSSYFEKKDYSAALTNFREIIEKYPNDFFAPIAQYFIGETFLMSGKPRDALFAYTRVIHHYPDDSMAARLARYQLAWTRYQLEDFAQTAQDCRDFLTLYPTDPLSKDVELILGNAYRKLDRHEDAISAFQRVLDLAPNSGVAEQALFSILQDEFEQKSYYAIITSYQFIFRQLPPSQSKWRILSYLYAADAYLSLNHAAEAKAIYKIVLKLYTDSPYALYAQDGLAWAYAYEGDDEKALAARKKLQDMLSMSSSTSSFSGASEMGIADSLFNQQKYEQAYELYSRFTKDNPQSSQMPQALYHEGLSLYHMRYYSQAVAAWDQLAAGYPKSPEARKSSFEAADTLFRAQKYPEAIAAYRRIIHDYIDSQRLPLAYLRIAQSFFNEKEDSKALAEIQDFAPRFPKAPESVDALDLLDSIFDRSKNVDYKQVLNALISQYPSSLIAAEATYRLARRAFEDKDYATAATYFQKFSVNYTEHPKLARAQFYLGESSFEEKNYADAIPPFERFVDNFAKTDETPLALFHLAGSQYALKQYAKAAKNYERLLREYPGSEYEKPVEFNLALAYKDLGNLNLSEQAYQKYAETVGAKSPDGRAAYWEILEIQKRQRDYDAALKTLDALETSAKDPAERLEVLYRKGELFVSMERPDEELNVWKKMRLLTPDNSPFRLQALIKLGEMYEKYDDFSDAILVYKDLAKNASGDLSRQAAARIPSLKEQLKNQPAISVNKNPSKNQQSTENPATAGSIPEIENGGN
jgi:TolA-binding protein